MVEGNKCAKKYKTGGIDEVGHEIPLRNTTSSDKNTINMMDDSRRLNNTDKLMPIKITESRNGRVRANTTR